MRPTAKIITYFLLGMLFAAMVFASPAQAQTREIETKWLCGRTDAIKEDLVRSGEQFWASGAVQGSTEPRFLMSIWVNPSSKSWTIVATLLEDNSLSCVMSFGTAWREQPHNYI
jgi:hypothetical protein